MSFQVPFVRPRDHYRALKGEIDGAITDTLSRGDLVLRQQLRDFEARLASYVGVKYAVGVASGYHALHLSLVALGIGPGDEVITVAHTFVATVSAILHSGETPVLVDVRDDDGRFPALGALIGGVQGHQELDVVLGHHVDSRPVRLELRERAAF